MTRATLRLALVMVALWEAAAACRAAPIPRFDTRAARAHVRQLAVDIGVRRGASAAEQRAAAYITTRMEAWGYRALRQPVALPDGRTTLNLIFDTPGSLGWSLTLGAHIDSKPPSPGANDNASGVATLLEIAHALSVAPPPVGIRYIFFGSEEIQGKDEDAHHFGSRGYVARMTEEERARCGGMICVDTVAGGPHLVIGSMGPSSPLARDLRLLARRRGYTPEGRRDPGWSDHEPFEKAGFTVAYVRWRIDPTLHTARDDFRHIDAHKMAVVGDLLIAFLTAVRERYPGPR